MGCVSDQQCRTWATGQFCCQDGRCCDDSPDYLEDNYDYNYDYYQYQYEYYGNNNYSDYHTTQSYDYINTNTSQDNSSDFVHTEDLEEDILPWLLNETTTESAENDYDLNNSSDLLFEDTEPGLGNETSEDYYENTNSSDLFEDVILSGLGNETTTTEPAENDYEIPDTSDREEISPEKVENEDIDEVADVEIVTFDKTEDEEEQAVKVTTFYETFNKTSAEEKLDYDPTKEEAEHLVDIIELTEVVASAVENITGDDVYYSGSGDVSENLSVENLNDEELQLTDELQIENFSLETDEREMSTVVSESSLEISLKYDDDLGDLHLEPSGSGDQLLLEEQTDGDLEGGSGSEMFGEIQTISQTYEDSLPETSVSAENLEISNDLDITVKDVEVVKKPTNLVGKSTNEESRKSDAIGKTISVSLIIFVIFTMNL